MYSNDDRAPPSRWGGRCGRCGDFHFRHGKEKDPHFHRRGGGVARFHEANRAARAAAIAAADEEACAKAAQAKAKAARARKAAPATAKGNPLLSPSMWPKQLARRLSRAKAGQAAAAAEAEELREEVASVQRCLDQVAEKTAAQERETAAGFNAVAALQEGINDLALSAEVAPPEGSPSPPPPTAAAAMPAALILMSPGTAADIAELAAASPCGALPPPM